MARVNHMKLTNRILVCREYAGLWQAYFSHWSDDMTDRKITPQMEQDFSNLVNVLALNHYKFAELCGEFMKDSEEVLKILAQTPSLEILKETPEATLSKLMVSWHVAFLDMNKALGKLTARLSPKELAELQATEAAAGQPAPAAQ